MIALRAIAFQATPWLRGRAVLAIEMHERTLSGYATVHSSARMPPRDPPLTASRRSIPNRSRARFSARTMSATVITGKSRPYGLPVAGLIELGPVEPRHDPIRLVQTTQ